MSRQYGPEHDLRGGAVRDRPKSRSADRDRQARGTPQAGRLDPVVKILAAVCSLPILQTSRQTGRLPEVHVVVLVNDTNA